MTDDLVGRPIGFLYSKQGALQKMNGAGKPLTRARVNLRDPSPEDIAAGLSAEQCAELIELRRDNSRRRNQLDKPIPGWRDALIVDRGYGAPVILTAMGSRVRDVLLASGTEARQRQDREAGPDPEGDGPTAPTSGGDAQEQTP